MSRILGYTVPRVPLDPYKVIAWTLIVATAAAFWTGVGLLIWWLA